MKFKVKASSAFLSDGSMVREGIIEASGEKADMLKELADKSPRTIEVLSAPSKATPDAKKVVKEDFVKEDKKEEKKEFKSEFKKARK